MSKPFPPELMAVNKDWNNFIADNLDWYDAFEKKRHQIYHDPLITDIVRRERLQDLYIDEAPRSYQLKELYDRLKMANEKYKRMEKQRLTEENDAPYWAKLIDETLKGSPAHEDNPTQRTIFIPGVDNAMNYPDGTVSRRKGRN